MQSLTTHRVTPGWPGEACIGGMEDPPDGVTDVTSVAPSVVICRDCLPPAPTTAPPGPALLAAPPPVLAPRLMLAAGRFEFVLAGGVVFFENFSGSGSLRFGFSSPLSLGSLDSLGSLVSCGEGNLDLD